MSKAHKHAEVIKQWADDSSVVIEWRRPPANNDWGVWNNFPLWDESNEYRIKPAKTYPVTQMSGSELFDVYTEGDSGRDNFFAVANAALRHAIDAGQVVIAEEHQELLGRYQCLEDSRLILQANLKLVEDQRDSRDMAIAEAARREMLLVWASTDEVFVGRAIERVSLAAIIASVPK